MVTLEHIILALTFATCTTILNVVFDKNFEELTKKDWLVITLFFALVIFSENFV